MWYLDTLIRLQKKTRMKFCLMYEIPIKDVFVQYMYTAHCILCKEHWRGDCYHWHLAIHRCQKKMWPREMLRIKLALTQHPGKLTWNLKITCFKRKIIFQTLWLIVTASLQCKMCYRTEVPGKYTRDVAKLQYFTNLCFPEIRGFPFLRYLLGWGRVRSL